MIIHLDYEIEDDKIQQPSSIKVNKTRMGIGGN